MNPPLGPEYEWDWNPNKWFDPSLDNGDSSAMAKLFNSCPDLFNTIVKSDGSRTSTMPLVKRQRTDELCVTPFDAVVKKYAMSLDDKDHFPRPDPSSDISSSCVPVGFQSVKPGDKIEPRTGRTSLKRKGIKRQGDPVKNEITKKQRPENSPHQPSIFLCPDVLQSIMQLAVQSLHGRDAIKYLYTLNLVSKLWNAVMTPRLKKQLEVDLLYSGHISLNDMPGIKTKYQALPLIKAHQNGLKTLILRASDGWDEDDIKTILDQYPKQFETLVFDFNHNAFMLNIFDNIVGLEGIKNLTIKYERIFNYTNLNKFTQLTKLNLHASVWCYNIRHIVNACPHLVELILCNDSQSLFREVIDFSPIKQLNCLKHLTFVCAERQDFRFIEELDQLETLNIKTWCHPHIQPQSINFQKLTRLNKLHIVGDGISPEILGLSQLNNLMQFTANIGPLKTVLPLPVNLKILELKNCRIETLPRIDHLKSLERYIMRGHWCELQPDYEIDLKKKIIVVDLNSEKLPEKECGF